MNKVTVEIRCDNAAFEHFPEEEVARILQEISTNLEEREFPSGSFTQDLRDINGNVVGKITVT